MIKRVLMTQGTDEKGMDPFHMFQAQWKPENDAGMEELAVGSRHNAEGERRKPKSLSKIMNKIDDLEFKMCKMSTADPRSRDTLQATGSSSLT